MMSKQAENQHPAPVNRAKLALMGRTPEGFTVNSRGWSEARATPPDSRRRAPEPRRGSPGTKPSNRSGGWDHPAGVAGVAGALSGGGLVPRAPPAIQRQSRRGWAGESRHRLSQRLMGSDGWQRNGTSESHSFASIPLPCLGESAASPAAARNCAGSPCLLPVTPKNRFPLRSCPPIRPPFSKTSTFPVDFSRNRP